MLKKLDEQSIDVMLLALQEAKTLGHKCVSSEHVLLGLVGKSKTLSGRLLQEAGADFNELRLLIKARNTVNTHMFPLPDWLQWLRAFEEMPLSMHSKQILELALQQADGWQEDKVSPEHLLIGLLKLPDSGALEMLKLKSISPDELGIALLDTLGKPGRE